MGAPRETSWSPSLDWVGDLNCLTDDFPSLDGGREFFPVDNFLSEALDALLGNEASHVNLPAGEHLWSPVPPPPDPTLAAGATAQSGHPLAAPEALPHQVPAPPVSPPLDTPDARAGESAGKRSPCRRGRRGAHAWWPTHQPAAQLQPFARKRTNCARGHRRGHGTATAASRCHTSHRAALRKTMPTARAKPGGSGALVKYHVLDWPLALAVAVPSGDKSSSLQDSARVVRAVMCVCPVGAHVVVVAAT